MKFFDVWYQKFLLRFSFMIAFLAFLGVFVYANDTSLLDSVLYQYGTKEITLQGDIPLNF